MNKISCDILAVFKNMTELISELQDLHSVLRRSRGICKWKGITFEFFPFKSDLWVNVIKIERLHIEKLDRVYIYRQRLEMWQHIMAFVSSITNNVANKIWLANQCLNYDWLDSYHTRTDYIEWLRHLIGSNGFYLKVGDSTLKNRVILKHKTDDYDLPAILDKIDPPVNKCDTYLIPEYVFKTDNDTYEGIYMDLYCIVARFALIAMNLKPEWGDLIQLQAIVSERDSTRMISDGDNILPMSYEYEYGNLPPAFKVLGARNKPLDYWSKLSSNIIHLEVKDYPELKDNIEVAANIDVHNPDQKYILQTTFINRGRTYYIIYAGSNDDGQEGSYGFDTKDEALQHVNDFKDMLDSGTFEYNFTIENVSNILFAVTKHEGIKDKSKMHIKRQVTLLNIIINKPDTLKILDAHYLGYGWGGVLKSSLSNVYNMVKNGKTVKEAWIIERKDIPARQSIIENNIIRENADIRKANEETKRDRTKIAEKSITFNDEIVIEYIRKRCEFSLSRINGLMQVLKRHIISDIVNNISKYFDVFHI